MSKNLAILGSTGSIGCQAVEVCLQLGLRVKGLTFNRNVEAVLPQIESLRPDLVATPDERAAFALAKRLRERGGDAPEILTGAAGVAAVASAPELDMVLLAISGFASIGPAMAAARAGHDLALASKEAIIVAGPLLQAEMERNNARIIPVDSEHSAIWQCLRTGRKEDLAKIWLCASGGPFLGRSYDELRAVTPEEALRHPTWQMGKRITIDSATMVNKGLEIIEACRLFDVQPEQVEVVIHPQSVIHSMVEWADHSVIAQLSAPDMRLPIQIALTVPERLPGSAVPFDPFKLNRLTFVEPDPLVFRALPLAYEAARCGGSLPLTYNAADEVAVAAFLAGELSFTGITELIERVMDRHMAADFTQPASAEELFELDAKVREDARQMRHNIK